MEHVDRHFPSIHIVLFAATTNPGERISPIALAAMDAATGRIVEIGVPKLLSVRRPPYATGPQSVLISVDAASVIGCHLALGWRLPERVLDLMVEYRNQLNGRVGAVGGLSGALIFHGLSALAGLNSGISPGRMRQRLSAVAALFARMSPAIDLGRALLRGRYLCAVARIEAVGVPVDRELIDRMAERWGPTTSDVVEIIAQQLGLLVPRLAGETFDLNDDAFRDRAGVDPKVRSLRDIRATLSDFDPLALTIGRDRRNRTPLRPFSSRTGRNQPSTKASVLGTAAWVRHLILPSPGTGLALIDWSQQEFGIAAALSGDATMQQAYLSGDPYLAIAVLAGAAPSSATPATHPDVRAQYKVCVLGMHYGMGTATLARITGLSEVAAQQLQDHHRAAFPAFWFWSDASVTHAYLACQISSVFGWRISVDDGANPRMLRNFPLQSNGAEMLRLACCLATEDGISVCMPLHDALLIEAPLGELEDAIRRAQEHMAEASRVVLAGFELRSDVKVVRAPNRWHDPRGAILWEAVEQVLANPERARTAPP